MGRSPCCDKHNVKRGPWAPEEDAQLKSYIHQQGPVGNWIALPQKIGLNRCGKSCRLRWLNYLRPNIKHGAFSEEEDRLICSLYVTIGSRWSIIAARLPGRTDNDIKNHWNTSLKKRLFGKLQRSSKPPQHKRSRSRLAAGSIPASVEPTSSSAAAAVPYNWPVPLVQTPAVSLNVVEDQTEPIRRLLLKLGGRFSETSGATYTVGDQQVHEGQSVYVPAPCSSSSSSMDGGYLGMLDGQNYNLAGEMSRLLEMNCDMKEQAEGLEFLYGDDEQMAGINGLVWS